MNTKLALIAIYVPLVVMAGWAVVLYAKSILWPALRERKISFVEHGIVIAMCASFSADVVEQVYWMTARLLPQHWERLSWAVSAVFTMKLVAMFGAMCAISAWHQAVRGHGIMSRLITLVVGLYLGAFATLVVTMT